MNGPLDGLIVFDLTRILAGPSCTQILGDLGAEIIKVERPGSGDDTRNFAPPYLPNDAGEDSSESAYFAGTNRNKRSITLNLSDAEGQQLAKRFIARSDILVENFKTGTLAKYGLGYEAIRDEFSETHLLLDNRIRSYRSLRRPARLRRLDPSDGRCDGVDRRARR